METHNCQNCKKDFTIEPDDFAFYEKIGVPAPTFCSECRLVRRMAATNERVLYFRTCDLSGQKILSMFPAGTPFPVYRTSDWYSDEWDPYKYGQEYDFNRPFFEQFLGLQNKVPRMALVHQGESINSDYTHRVHDMKNSYMVFRMSGSEDSSYCYVGRNIIDCVDCFSIWDCQSCYECIDCNNCYMTLFSQESHDCRNSYFLYACRNCSNCVGCVNLVNQSYCIFNEQYTKEEYDAKFKELKLNTASGLDAFWIQFEEFRKRFPHRSIHSLKSDNVSGNWIVNCQNVKDSYGCLNVKDGKNLFWIWDAEDCRDYFQWGNHAELVYESENCGINISRIFFSSQCWMGAHDLSYCDSCPGSSFCFGCIGIRKGEYSILNKRYSKEEYNALVPKIIQHMKEMPYIDNQGKIYGYGEYFPDELSPFAYNETAAIDFFPITKEDAESKGYRWQEKEKKNYEATFKNVDLPETIKEVDDSIFKEIIECAEKDKLYSVGVFRITPDELNFYRKMDLPLPRVCFDVRHTRRLHKRLFLKIKKRDCTKCGVEVQSVYDEKYAPIIYCPDCYQKEVY